MEREIRFRAKSIFKNEWWDGFYIYSNYEKKHFIVQNATDNKHPSGSISFSHFAEIDIKTLGQFTGLTDKNGKDIYEGDVCIDINGKKRIVLYEYGFWSWKYYEDPENDWEIIGNIHTL